MPKGVGMDAVWFGGLGVGAGCEFELQAGPRFSKGTPKTSGAAPRGNRARGPFGPNGVSITHKYDPSEVPRVCVCHRHLPVHPPHCRDLADPVWRGGRNQRVSEGLDPDSHQFLRVPGPKGSYLEPEPKTNGPRGQI